MSLLKKGAIVGSDVTGECYQVTSGRIAEGGFGEIYRGVLLDGRRDPVRDVAIKVLTNPLSWHGEAYFGRLLEDYDRVVRLLDAFQMASGSGAARLTKYLLVFEWMDDGTVWDFLQSGRGPVPEAGVLNQAGEILELTHRPRVVPACQRDGAHDPRNHGPSGPAKWIPPIEV